MKKVMFGAALATVMAAGFASAGAFEGFNTNFSLGYTSMNGKIKWATTGTSNYQVEPGSKRTSGVNLGAGLGYGMKVGARGHVGFGLGLGYDFTKAKIGYTTATDNDYYKPRFGLELSGRAGWFFSDCVLGYARLGVGADFARLEDTYGASKVSKNITVCSLTPGLGVDVKFHDNMTWGVELAYKIGLKQPSVTNVNGFDLKAANKPSAFIARVGVTYHF